MAVTKNPLAADAATPYTVTRAFFWAGEVVQAGAVLQLTKTEAADLLMAKKVTPCEPDKAEPKPEAKPAKAK